MSDQSCTNTDRELWRERPGDYYADSIHVTADGNIGINCGGTVRVMPLREWHRLAALPSAKPVDGCEPMTKAALSMGRAIHSVVEQIERLTRSRKDGETFTADVKYMRGLSRQLMGLTNAHPDTRGAESYVHESARFGVSESTTAPGPNLFDTRGADAVMKAAKVIVEMARDKLPDDPIGYDRWDADLEDAIAAYDAAIKAGGV